MRTLKFSVSMPDETHPDVELRLSADELVCDVVVIVPAEQTGMPSPAAEMRVSPGAPAPLPAAANDAASSEDDAYVLGGYAGI